MDPSEENKAGANAPASNNHGYLEKFEVYHRNDCKPVNKTEQHMLRFAKDFLKQEISLNLIQVIEALQKELDHYTKYNRKHGFCYFDLPRISTTYAGSPHFCHRQVDFYAKGRKTYTFSIQETIAKDSNNNFEVADFGFNNPILNMYP